MLFDCFTVMQITNNYTNEKLNIALTKEEYETYTKNGRFSEEFIVKTFIKYNHSKQKRRQ